MSISVTLKHYYKRLLDYVVPPFCYYCKRLVSSHSLLCAPCLHDIKPLVSTVVAVTPKYPMPIFALSAYQDPIKTLILSKNYQDLVTFKHLAVLVAQHLEPLHLDFDYIVPIPLHWTRYAWRGFNQADVIAQAISKKSNKPVIKVLRRIQRTSFQASLSADKRQENIKNAFVLKQSCNIEGKKILLVDDLMTTGSTLMQAAKILTKEKPASLQAMVIARVL